MEVVITKFFKSNWKLLAAFLLIVFAFPFIILVKSPVGMIPENVGLAVVSYGGSIIGGFLTLYGVWWTIDANRVQQKEERELEYRPLLKFDVCKYQHRFQQVGEIIYLFHHEYFLDAQPEYMDQMIVLENVGRGEIVELHCRVCETELVTSCVNSLKEATSYFLGEQSINTIPVNGKIYIVLGIPCLKRKCQGKLMILKTDMEIKYKGAFSEKEYSQKLSFCLSAEIVEDHYKMDLYNMSLVSTGLHS